MVNIDRAMTGTTVERDALTQLRKPRNARPYPEAPPRRPTARRVIHMSAYCGAVQMRGPAA